MKRSIAQKSLSVLGAAALLGGFASLGATNASAQTSTNLLSFTSFDAEAASPWSYGYFYGNNGLGFYENNRSYYLPEDFELTNAFYFYAFDLTDLAGTAAYGTGTGAPLFLNDPAGFITGERANYIFTFDARVEGLAEGQTSGNGEMQVQFYMPGETDAVKVLQINLPFLPTTEWTTFRFTLDQGSISGDSSEASFSTNFNAMSEIRFNVNFHEPHNQFGYDGPNALFVDNVKVEVVDRPTTPPVETTPVIMAEWNFDDKTVWYEYNYNWVSPGGEPLVQTAGNNANGAVVNDLGRDGSSAWFLNIDNSVYASSVASYAGAGTGGGGPVDLTLFNSTNLADYRITFDARIEGLAPERTTGTSALLQFFLDAPDDTVQPVDENTDNDLLVQLNFPIPLLSVEWQTYSFLLSKGNLGGGTKERFAELLSAINGLRTQWQLENATDFAVWGYDADNTLVIDNFKLERLIPVASEPTLNLAQEGNQLVLSWIAPDGSNIRLQSAETLGGEWSDVTDATSGYTVETTGSSRFFRLVQE